MVSEKSEKVKQFLREKNYSDVTSRIHDSTSCAIAA